MYMKFVDYERKHTVLRSTNGQKEFRHDKGELSLVQIEIAGIGTRGIRIAKIPPEVPDGVIRTVFAK
jgi:hypothetical protein